MPRSTPFFTPGLQPGEAAVLWVTWDGQWGAGSFQLKGVPPLESCCANPCSQTSFASL